ncbi:MAG: hypothetical protein ABIY55_17240 [Kofleriaceae bacterium]
MAGTMTGILAINCGSSSLKYAMFDEDRATIRGSIDGIGGAGVADHAAAVTAMFGLLAAPPRAIGHRIVHGGRDRTAPVVLDAAIEAELAALIPFAPLHLPVELAAVAAVRARYGHLPQVACFDTAFHATLPEVARRFALPTALHDAGLRRYGFHGLSYESVASSLAAPPPRRAIFAHLGSGASMVAVRDGRAIDTTMAFTPAAGLVMATRPGDLDPGLLLYLLDHGYDARRLEQLIHHEAGLLAISETSSDMQRLLACRAADPRAALAIDVFCYRAKLWVGALAAALGGLDTLVFTGGIGQHAPDVRAQICDGLQHLGIELDPAANARHGPQIGAGRCEVHVIAADEERVVAAHTRRVVDRAASDRAT